MRMRKHAGRLGVLGSGLVLATVALTAVAYACTNLATVNLSKGSGVAGTSVTVTGSSFATAASGQGTPVVLHWNGASGPVLAKAMPNGAGNISTTFTVPRDAQPGYHVIVATQASPEGEGAAFGTPARATFQVTSPGGAAAAPQPAPQPAPASAPPSSSGPAGILALTVGLGVLGLALFGVGITAFLRQARRREAPVPATVRRED